MSVLKGMQLSNTKTGASTLEERDAADTNKWTKGIKVVYITNVAQ